MALREGRVEEIRVEPEALGLSRTGRSSISWVSPENEAGCLLAVLDGRGTATDPVRDLLLYNAALRLWTSDMDVQDAPLKDYVERARAALDSGSAARLVHELSQSPALESTKPRVSIAR